MKFLIIFAALASVALAEFHFFVEDREIVNEITKKIDFKNNNIIAGDHREVIIRSPKNIIEDQITAFLESNRENIPDPIRYEKLSLRLHQPLIFTLDVDIENILIAGLQRFVIDNISFNLLGRRLNFNIVIPDITYESAFAIDGKVAMILPLDMSGIAKMRMDNFAIGGQTRFGITSSGYMSLTEFSLTLDIEKLSVYVSGLVGNGQVNDIINFLLNQFTDDIFNGQKEALEEYLSESLFNTLSDILSQIYLGDLIG